MCTAQELTNLHLLAEYRELPRVFNLARPAKGKETFPIEYTLGAGHVKFFYTRLGYCYNRQQAIVAEMKQRGYKPKFEPVTLWNEYNATKSHLWNDWLPNEKEMTINRNRIKERLLNV